MSEVFSAILIYIGNRHVDYCCMIIYTFFVGMSAVNLIEKLGKIF